MDTRHPSRRALALLLAILVAAAPAFAQERKAKQAVDDRADTRMRSDDVGKGTHFARKPLQQGAYFNDRSRAAVQKYYASHPAQGGQARHAWSIGEKLPAAAVTVPVPSQLVASLPPVPPGHQYVEVAGDILLIASGSKMVVDAINGPAR